MGCENLYYLHDTVSGLKSTPVIVTSLWNLSLDPLWLQLSCRFAFREPLFMPVTPKNYFLGSNSRGIVLDQDTIRLLLPSLSTTATFLHLSPLATPTYRHIPPLLHPDPSSIFEGDMLSFFVHTLPRPPQSTLSARIPITSSLNIAASSLYHAHRHRSLLALYDHQITRDDERIRRRIAVANTFEEQGARL
ncbi:hypothetical protein BJ165DRAFT_233979 [Panaeolus papilionaceus]|nr:hypothetical protein BJ165DRAFT_233979 [Panaeolus papilionaceus]